ncbi:hypothetical protein [Oceanobacillus sp. CF4.6]|uniref:hypothetical protein n=1 Tax=Oceanobacillus sp. CF4.6 TaxID=3373080 RepID=UPI003EE7B83B
MEKDKVTFEEFFKQNERRIHYHINKLQLRDPHQEFYQNGLVAMWNAYKRHTNQTKDHSQPTSTISSATV